MTLSLRPQNSHCFREIPGDCRLQGVVSSQVRGGNAPRIFCFCRESQLSSDRSGPYRCNFCAENLHQQSLEGWKRILILTPLRSFKCPHCFNVFLRPLSVIGYLPGVRWLFGTAPKDKLRQAMNTAKRGSEKSSGMEWKLGRSLLKLGRWITSAEQGLVSGLLGMVHRLFVRKPSKSRRSKSSRKRSRSSTEN